MVIWKGKLTFLMFSHYLNHLCSLKQFYSLFHLVLTHFIKMYSQAFYNMYFYVIVHRIFFITTYDVWNLNSPTRDQTRALESERYKFVSFKESIPPVHIILGNRSEQYGFLVLFLVLISFYFSRHVGIHQIFV